ncbi:histidine decarboxylase [Streptomyces regalis]|nr:histidine decarboxylase [Streptomyces regalis]
MTHTGRTAGVHHSSVPYGPDHMPWSQILMSQGLADGFPAPISDPVFDPCTVYPAEEELPDEKYQLPPSGLTKEQRRKALDNLDEYLIRKREYMLGYQVNQDMDGYRLDLSRFMEHHVNNVGDPFRSGGYKPNTKVIERAVLDYYAALWNAKWPHKADDPESYWGYMLSMGSTEGNMYALWNARDYLSGRALIVNPTRPADGMLYVQGQVTAETFAAEDKEEAERKRRNALRPVVFYSEDTHYSFTKAVRVLGFQTFHEMAMSEPRYTNANPLGGAWPTEVPSLTGTESSADGPGEIDIDKLATLVEFFANNGHPIMVSLNLGSTFKGAHDNVGAVCEKLLPIFEEHHLVEREIEYEKGKKDIRRGFWIHVDGALGAAYAPFLRMAEDNPGYAHVPEVKMTEFDFGLQLPRVGVPEAPPVDMISSIAMSGHKWPGAPWPCGIYMTKVKYQLKPPASPQYIGAPDTTFAGSRNGFSPVILWDYLAKHSYDQQISGILRAQRLARYLEQQLKRLSHNIGIDLWVARTPGTLTVRFRKPNPELVAKWSLSSQQVVMNPQEKNPKRIRRRDYAHVFVMASTTEEQIDALIKDLHRADAFPEQIILPIIEPVPELLDEAVSLALVPEAGRGFE